ncbi:MAG: protein-L-isoaspartate O-methyltransferase [Pseudomonadota bacterium]
MIDFATNRTMMVDTQVRPSDVTKFPIIDAMLSIRREVLVPATRRDVAYADTNISIGPSRVILEPRSLGKMLDVLDVQSSDMALVIGAAYGYSSAVLARMCETVIAVESDADIASAAETALLEQGADNVVVLEGELSAGAAKHGPYDVILIEGAVERVPDALEHQLKEGGRIVAIFAGDAAGECRLGIKADGRVNWRLAFHAGAPIMPGFEAEKTFSL